MPHQCVRCNTFYDDGSEEILKGCTCGGKLFFYVRKEKLEESKKLVEKANLSEKEKKWVFIGCSMLVLAIQWWLLE